LKIKVESKEPVPAYRGSASPTLLAPPYPGFVLQDTKESSLLRTTMSRMFAGKIYDFRLTVALNISSSGTGAVNSAINNSVLSTTPDFIALTGVFNEFFITRFNVKYEPVSMYNYPLTGAIGTNVSSLPIGLADLQHGQLAYSSLSLMTNNFRFALNNTGRPFEYSWINTESPSSTVLPSLAASGAATQSWCLVTDAASYAGTMQVLSQPSPPNLPVSAVLGVFLVEWYVKFRVRD
jgi:hypothetical protein